MELKQSVAAYVDELETNSPAPSCSHLTLATLYDRFGQAETDNAIATECKNRERQRYLTALELIERLHDEQRRCSIPKTRREIVLECISDFAPDGIVRTEN